MTTLVVLDHPDMPASRANARMIAALTDLPDVVVRDLRALYPDGHIDVAAEQEAVAAADRLVWQFPFHWYSAPGLLKQWQDDVFAYGWAYGSTGNALQGKKLMVAVTTGAPAENYQPEGVYGHTMEHLLAPFEAVCALTGMVWEQPFIVAGAMGADDATLDAAAKEYAEYLAR
ncbi:NAD(P)H-dependent oxidoreductase [Schaalia sp. 19OD2882]|uniref:NAD(P)H-dependent oxidoreductase n=1 Tax=Schaalia sp. 19OD2882 TaxID=2794089 RepID=UPI001C1EAD81|nr:NAD(P)H-dependent oxidoreductase [Schaalia sp. 19OD2882]QWW20043.1 NAD(P)H-dependent oxidoreductase [Schaalia sp. 19OD2882]